MVITADIIPPDKWWRRVKYRLIKPVEVGCYSVPEGFVSDGATVPRLLWPIFPPVGRYMVAALVHDYQLTRTSREAADQAFADTMKVLDIEPWRRHLMYIAVRLYSALVELRI